MENINAVQTTPLPNLAEVLEGNKTMTIPTINLYGEAGISILVDSYGDIVISDESEAIEEAAKFGIALTRVIGHTLYACDLHEAQAQIRDAYLSY